VQDGQRKRGDRRDQRDNNIITKLQISGTAGLGNNNSKDYEKRYFYSLQSLHKHRDRRGQQWSHTCNPVGNSDAARRVKAYLSRIAIQGCVLTRHQMVVTGMDSLSRNSRNPKGSSPSMTGKKDQVEKVPRVKTKVVRPGLQVRSVRGAFEKARFGGLISKRNKKKNNFGTTSHL